MSIQAVVSAVWGWVRAAWAWLMGIVSRQSWSWLVRGLDRVRASFVALASSMAVWAAVSVIGFACFLGGWHMHRYYVPKAGGLKPLGLIFTTEDSAALVAARKDAEKWKGDLDRAQGELIKLRGELAKATGANEVLADKLKRQDAPKSAKKSAGAAVAPATWSLPALD